MTVQEISEGIKLAMSKGWSFEQAKNSFIHAGYSPEEVEQAARAINQVSYSSPEQNKIQAQKQFVPKIKEQEPIKPEKTTQIVSDYNQIPKSRVWLFILIGILIIILIGIIGVLIFRENLTNFFTDLFN